MWPEEYVERDYSPFRQFAIYFPDGLSKLLDNFLLWKLVQWILTSTELTYFDHRSVGVETESSRCHIVVVASVRQCKGEVKELQSSVCLFVSVDCVVATHNCGANIVISGSIIFLLAPEKGAVIVCTLRRHNEVI